MKNRLSFAIVVLVAAMLACKVPLIDDQPEGASFTEILSMAVKPPAGPGSGSFKLEVKYRAYREDPPEIYCNYVRPDGAAIYIGTIVPLGPRGTLFTIRPYSTTETRELPFSVTKKDSVTKLGTYTAGCGDGYGKTLTTTFIVVEEVGEDEWGRDFSKVLNMAVTPPAGSGNFTLEVTYRWNDSIADTGSPPDIHCNYLSPDGATMPVGIIYPTYVKVTTTKIEKLEFSVTQKDGKTIPGTYVASCVPRDDDGDEDGTTVTTTFEVVEDTAPDLPIPPAQLPPPEQPEQLAFTMAGTFSLTWNGKESTSGEIQITIDPNTGLATGFLSGSGSGANENCDVDDPNNCNYFEAYQWNYSYTALNLTGSMDPLTGALALNGIADGTFDRVETNCLRRWDDGTFIPFDSCDAMFFSYKPEGLFSVYITGTVNLVNLIGRGGVEGIYSSDSQWSGSSPSRGEWQAGP